MTNTESIELYIECQQRAKDLNLTIKVDGSYLALTSDNKKFNVILLSDVSELSVFLWGYEVMGGRVRK